MPFFCAIFAYFANASIFASIHSCVGISSPMFITALHLVNFAPNLAYSAHLSSRTSRPWVNVSTSESLKGFNPLSTFIPGKAPLSSIRSISDWPASVFCLIVSSNKITPPIFPLIPFDEKSSSL